MFYPSSQVDINQMTQYGVEENTDFGYRISHL